MNLQDTVRKQLRNHLSPAQHEAFDLYVRKLLDARRRTNLTSLRDRDAIERRLFLESIALLNALTDAGAVESPVIDVGTGAGIPGLPLKIMRPDLEVVLLDATGKKVRFLEEVLRHLGLNGVRVLQGRAEELAHDLAHREAYALALARAVAPLRILVELALPFVRQGGYLAAAKGSGAAREVREAEKALAECGGAIDRLVSLDVPGPGPVPTLVLVRKIAPTPQRYPRRTGLPQKRPL
jgi:16S rRNA (guanine527-N7)-methyltransferase